MYHMQSFVFYSDNIDFCHTSSCTLTVLSTCELWLLWMLSCTLLWTFLALSAHAGDGRTVQFFHLLLRDLLPHAVQTTGGRGASDLRDQTKQRLDAHRARSECGDVNLLRGSWRERQRELWVYFGDL